MSLKPLRECPACRGSGYQIERRDGITPDNPEGLRWIKVRCSKCRGMGFVRE